MPAPSLLQLSTATAIRNVKYLNDIGNTPYALARPFLLKIESPEKLRTLELQSPHLIREDTELWLEFIKRDIPRWDEHDLPETSECWYDVYCDLQDRVQRAVDEDAEKLRMALEGISSERAKHSAKFVADRRDIGLPRERPTAKQRYASYDRRMGGIRPVFSSQRSSMGSSDPQGTSLWSFDRPQVPREAKKKNSIFTATKRNTVLAVPTQHLNNRASQVKQAPRSLVEEHRRPQQQPVAVPRRREIPMAGGGGGAAPSLRAPGRRSGVQGVGVAEPRLQSPVVTPSLREREARLRAITSGRRSAASHTSASPGRPSQVPSRPSSAAAASPPKRRVSASSPAKEPLPGGSSRPMPRARTSAFESDGAVDVSSDADDAKGPAPPPRGVIRKRPVNVFMPPKKRKMP
ncbi:hypothetical protein FE257_013057 [Aspergillus nanangensis]|uniref:RNA polymerase II transcription factor SIII (Elongin) subunit A n=1 Tax=Aspergillus nanangensis TaxID=2582783 RepID=A0AAD4CF33_ASPNN|nr:hypothetical protein FE257_013057 [Aspergillus nanangensis]